MFLLILLMPLLAILGAVVYATVLFFPVMLLLGAVHSYLPWVPALGWDATFFVLALLSLLVPTSAPTVK